MKNEPLLPQEELEEEKLEKIYAYEDANYQEKLHPLLIRCRIAWLLCALVTVIDYMDLFINEPKARHSSKKNEVYESRDVPIFAGCPLSLFFSWFYFITWMGVESSINEPYTYNRYLFGTIEKKYKCCRLYSIVLTILSIVLVVVINNSNYKDTNIPEYKPPTMWFYLWSMVFFTITLSFPIALRKFCNTFSTIEASSEYQERIRQHDIKHLNREIRALRKEKEVFEESFLVRLDALEWERNKLIDHDLITTH